jgi:hypothetical protein
MLQLLLETNRVASHLDPLIHYQDNLQAVFDTRPVKART